MKIQEAIELAIQSTYVDDELEVQALRKGLDIVKSECPFIEFLQGPPTDVPFKTGEAFVTTKVDGRDSRKMRQIKQADGRRTFVVPSLRLEAPIDGYISDPYWRSEEGRGDMANRTALHFGHSYTGLLRSHIIQGLLFAAEIQGNITNVRPVHLRTTVKNLVAASTEPISILSNTAHITTVQDEPFGRKVGINGEVRLFEELDANTLVVVRNEPKRVGFVRSDHLPEMFVAVPSPGLIRSSIVFHCGFCFWGGAPITKIVVESVS